MPPRMAYVPKLPDELYNAMQSVLDVLYTQTDEEGRDISIAFHELVSKRQVPDYYQVIRIPMAMNPVQKEVKLKRYDTFADFVRACAQIFHNAKLYNRPDSMIYEDAATLESKLKGELNKLKEKGIIQSNDAELPDLGPIPDPSPTPPQLSPEPEEDEDEEEEDEEEEKPKRRRRRRTANKDDDDDDAGANGGPTDRVDTRKKRGRPPRVDSPMECRIKNVMKGLRKLKDEKGGLRVTAFERLPDIKIYPDYYRDIKNPIALDGIRKRIKRREYKSVEQFEADMRLMFNNAKAYNEDESKIYKDACILEEELKIQIDIENARDDTELQENMVNPQNRANSNKQTRFPLAAIEHKNETYVVGDWVHIINPNDLTKPTVAQIFRTWQDPEGQKWINACWYYRPEQTVHSHDRKFYEHEVVKTGQYRDHQIDEIIEKCFVMFFTRYSRGRPKGIGNRQVYVCESRYNEVEKHFNKIKTWKSCIPDEVRGQDYELQLFEKLEPLKKFPSPIAHLLPPNATEEDPIPEAKLGAENAPPIVGAVYKRSKGPNDTPPPDASPTPAAAPVSLHQAPHPPSEYNENLSMTQMYKAAHDLLAKQTPHTPAAATSAPTPAPVPASMPSTPTPVMHRPPHSQPHIGMTPSSPYVQPTMTHPMQQVPLPPSLPRQNSAPYGTPVAHGSPQLVHGHTMPVATQTHSHPIPQSHTPQPPTVPLQAAHHSPLPQPVHYPTAHNHHMSGQATAPPPPLPPPPLLPPLPPQPATPIPIQPLHQLAQQTSYHPLSQPQSVHQPLLQPQYHHYQPLSQTQYPPQTHQVTQIQHTPLPYGNKQYNPPTQQPQAFTLPDSATSQIPPSITSQFLRDDDGRMIWFTVPPLDNANFSKPRVISADSSTFSSRNTTPARSVSAEVDGGDGGVGFGDDFRIVDITLGHSLVYLAKRKELLERKARRRGEREKENRDSKRAKLDAESRERKEVEKVMVKALGNLIAQMKA